LIRRQKKKKKRERKVSQEIGREVRGGSTLNRLWARKIDLCNGSCGYQKIEHCETVSRGIMAHDAGSNFKLHALGRRWRSKFLDKVSLSLDRSNDTRS